MSALITIRSMREGMSAIERRIADFVLDNAHLIRDYSSQQLASALGISQSSVVKFCQRLGFKGYPDLKLAIHEEVVRQPANLTQEQQSPEPQIIKISSTLLQQKWRAVEETLAINANVDLQKFIAWLSSTQQLYIIGIAEDSLVARELALQFMARGYTVISDSDPFSMRLALNSIGEHDLLFIVSSNEQHADLMALAHKARDRHAKVVSVTRLTAKNIHALADLALFVSANDKQAEIAAMLYRFALQHLFDCLYHLLGEHQTS